MRFFVKKCQNKTPPKSSPWGGLDEMATKNQCINALATISVVTTELLRKNAVGMTDLVAHEFIHGNHE
jgi:hypothetical protein